MCWWKWKNIAEIRENNAETNKRLVTLLDGVPGPSEPETEKKNSEPSERFTLFPEIRTPGTNNPDNSDSSSSSDWNSTSSSDEGGWWSYHFIVMPLSHSVTIYNLYNFIVGGGTFDYELIFFCA